MTPLEMAMKLASASNGCERHKCPFMSKCKGDYSTCVMKEIALMLRSQAAAIDSQNAMIKAFQDVLAATQRYIVDIEKINKRYHDLIVAFQHGYRPKAKKYSIKRSPNKNLTRKKKDPVEMDGKERFAYEPPRTTEPAPPMVVI